MNTQNEIHDRMLRYRSNTSNQESSNAQVFTDAFYLSRLGGNLKTQSNWKLQLETAVVSPTPGKGRLLHLALIHDVQASVSP